MKKKSGVWIGKWRVHPLREHVPEMSNEDFVKRLNFIKQTGNLYPIWLDGDDQILDGRGQLRACLALGLDPQFEYYLEGNPATFIMSTITRPKYGSALLAVVAARLMATLKAEEEAAILAATGDGEASKIFTGRLADRAGETVGGVSAPYVYEAKRMLVKHPDIVKRINSRKIERFSHARALATYSPAKRKAALKKIDADVDPAIVTGNERKSGDEWYTPDWILDAVRFAFGGRIGCDPCSPKLKTRVNAIVTYTKKHDGLDEKNPWPGDVFVNPPFSETKRWIERAITEARAMPNEKKIFFLLPVRPDTKYQYDLINAATDVLLLSGRVPFVKDGATSSGGGLNSTLIAGLNITTHLLVDAGLDGLVVSSNMKTWRNPDNENYQQILSEATAEQLAVREHTADELRDLATIIAQNDLEHEMLATPVRAKVKTGQNQKKN